MKGINVSGVRRSGMAEDIPWCFSDEQLKENGVFELAPATLLQAEEAAAVLGVRLSELRHSRVLGEPLLQCADAQGSIRYALGEVLAARLTWPETCLATASSPILSGRASVSVFLALAGSGGRWPFVEVGVARRPVDLFFALSLPIEQRGAIRWLTYPDFLMSMRQSLARQPFAEIAKKRSDDSLRLGANQAARTKHQVRS